MGDSSSFYCTSNWWMVVSDFKTIPCMLADPENDSVVVGGRGFRGKKHEILLLLPFWLFHDLLLKESLLQFRHSSPGNLGSENQGVAHCGMRANTDHNNHWVVTHSWIVFKSRFWPHYHFSFFYFLFLRTTFIFLSELIFTTRNEVVAR